MREEVAAEQENLAETVQAVERENKALRDLEQTNQVRRKRLKEQISELGQEVERLQALKNELGQDVAGTTAE